MDETSSNTPNAPVPLGEIKAGPSAFEQALNKNQKKLFLVALLAVLGVVIFIVTQELKQGKLDAAGSAFQNAKTADDLKKVIADHSGSATAGTAAIALADKLWAEDKKDEAIAGLQKFLSDFPSHPGAPTAKLKLGTKLMSMGKLDDAKNVLKPLADSVTDKFTKPVALIALGDLSREQKNAVEAKDYYQKALDAFAGTDEALKGIVKERLGIVDSVAPTQIEGPKVPEPAVPTPGNPVIPGELNIGQPIPINPNNPNPIITVPETVPAVPAPTE